MVLSFVYIDEFQGIVKQGFDFDSEKSFLYTRDEEYLFLEIQDLDKTFDFFPNNINLTAIVGENGTGKTTLLNAVARIISDHNTLAFCAILRDESDYYIYSNIKLNLKLNPNHKHHIISTYDEFVKLDFAGIYYSHVKAKSTYYIGSNVAMLSETYLNKCDRYDSKHCTNIDSIDAFEMSEVLRQISYVLNFDHSLYDITIPDLIELNIPEDYYNLIHSDTDDYGNFINHFIDGRFADLFKVNTENKVLISILLSILFDIKDILKYTKEDVLKIRLYEFITEIGEEPNTDSLISKISELSLIETWESKKDSIDEEFSSFVISIKNKFDFYNYWKEHFDTLTIHISKSQKENVSRLFDKYSKSLFRYGYFHTQWQGLSTGENARLSLYSRIYERLYNRQQTFYSGYTVKDNVLLLIDEGGTFFHPEWQRQYVFDLIKMIQSILLSHTSISNVQVILTTHSPFVISDLLREHIIYLKKKKVNNFNYCQVVKDSEKPLTFAGNINTLFKNSFFLHEGLSGKYSEYILNDIMMSLNNKESDREYSNEYISYIIGEVSEPILKGHLERLYQR